jgi:hypothetical protein
MTSSGRMDPVTLRTGLFTWILGLTAEALSRSASASLSASVSPSVSLVPNINPESSDKNVLYIAIPLGLFSCILIVAIAVQSMMYRRTVRLLSPNVQLIQPGTTAIPPLDLNAVDQQIIPSTAFSVPNPMNRVQKSGDDDPVAI